MPYLCRMAKTVLHFLKSIDFFKSITLLVAGLIPLALLYGLGRTDLAVSVIMGVFLCSPSDIPGSLRHMALSILIGSGIATLTTLAIHASFGTIFLLPVLCALVFSHSMLAVYGFRASLVSFSGLLAIILAFAHPTSGSDLWVHSGLILTGGLWYLGVTLLAHTLVYRRHNQLILAECMVLTARYLRTRGTLIESPQHSRDRQEKLFHLQTEINEKHEKLREIFASERARTGTSHSANKYILIFIELIDILELAMSNPADYRRISELFREQGEALTPFANIQYGLADRLEALAEVVNGERKMKAAEDVGPRYQRARETLSRYLETDPVPQTQEGAVVLSNLLDYERKQQRKIESMERVLGNLVNQEQVVQRSRDVEKFITHQDYDLRIIRENLSRTSAIFRHAVRLTSTVLCGYTIGTLLTVQNPYWIMLTIIVIMRPVYGLTKSRSIQRVYGTLIGAAIALGIVLLTQNPYFYGTLSAISLVFAFSLLQRNYAGAAVFVTLNVIFLYALIRPDAFTVIQFRVVDTALGAGLSFLASLFLWPSWEAMNVRQVISDSIRANRRYLQEINSFYEQKGELPTSYKLARKEAFLAMGELSAAFQRMSQEPKSKRQHFSEFYEMVVLNHTLLTAAAAMGTFIQHHVTSEKSEHFQTFIEAIDAHLREAQAHLQRKEPEGALSGVKLEQAKTYLDHRYQEVAGATEWLSQDSLADQEEAYQPWQEVGLITGQLNWLYSLSDNIRKAARELP